MTSIIKNHEITPKKITLNINFNPNNYNQIQTIDYNFITYYKSRESSEIISTNSFLYFYDYGNPFDEPYFTNDIQFNNDYDKIIALQATNEFWDLNYQFPKSFKVQKSIHFLKKYGNLINYENEIPTNDMEFTKPSVISWSKNKRLEWNNIKQSPLDLDTPNKHINRDLSTNMKVDKIYHSNSEFSENSQYFKKNKTFRFSYLLDKYIDSNGDSKFITRTLFDRKSSFYKNIRSKHMLIYLNLTFDIYEYYRQKLDLELHQKMTFDEVKELGDENFKKASLMIKIMKKETNSGLNFQSLILWNNDIKSKLGIDNYKQISNQI